MITVGQTIRRAREGLALTRQGLAEQAKISISYLYLIETDRRLPSVPILLRLAHLLHLDVDQMLVQVDRVHPDIVAYLNQRPEVRAMLRALMQTPIDADWLRGVIAVTSPQVLGDVLADMVPDDTGDR